MSRRQAELDRPACRGDHERHALRPAEHRLFEQAAVVARGRGHGALPAPREAGYRADRPQHHVEGLQVVERDRIVTVMETPPAVSGAILT